MNTNVTTAFSNGDATGKGKTKRVNRRFICQFLGNRIQTTKQRLDSNASQNQSQYRSIPRNIYGLSLVKLFDPKGCVVHEFTQPESTTQGCKHRDKQESENASRERQLRVK